MSCRGQTNSAEVYIGEEFIGVLFVDDEDDDRSFQFQMAILEEDLADVGVRPRAAGARLRCAKWGGR